MKTKINLILFVLLFCNQAMAINSSINVAIDSVVWKLPVDTFEIQNDTLVIETDESNDSFLYCPFGKYRDILTFIASNTWVNNTQETKSHNKEYKRDIYCFCNKHINICLWESHYWLIGEKEFVEIISNKTSILSQEVQLLHGIRVGITKNDFIAKLDIPQNSIYNISLIYLKGDNYNHYYYFENNILSKIIIETESRFNYSCN